MSKYDKSFKEEAIRLALTSPQPISKTARDLGLKESTLYNWISVAKDKASVIPDAEGNQTNLLHELDRLRKENAYPLNLPPLHLSLSSQQSIINIKR
ncbi:MAG: transposase [Gammaproteobacteria bacterium]